MKKENNYGYDIKLKGQINGQRTHTSGLVEQKLLGKTMKLDQWQECGFPVTHYILGWSPGIEQDTASLWEDLSIVL